MPRPYAPPLLKDNSPQSGATWVLLHQGIGVDLPLRNRHEDVPRPARARRFELPAVGVMPEPDQILPALPLTRELEQALGEHGVGSDRPARLRWIEVTSAQRVDET